MSISMKASFGVVIAGSLMFACTDVMRTGGESAGTLPLQTGSFRPIRGVPTGDAVLVREFGGPSPLDIGRTTLGVLQGVASYTIPEVVRFQVLGGSNAAQVWKPNKRQTMELRSKPFAKERVNATSAKYTLKYAMREVGVPVETNEPITNPVTSGVTSTNENFALTINFHSEDGDNFPTPNTTFGRKSLMTALLNDKGGPCARMGLNVLNFVLSGQWNGDDRDVLVSVPIGEELDISVVLVAHIFTTTIQGSAVKLLPEGTNADVWSTACQDKDAEPSVSLTGEVSNNDGSNRNFDDLLFQDTTDLGVLGISVGQGVTRSSYITADGENFSTEDFTLIKNRPTSLLDDLSIKVGDP